jgi:hypothetical protein
MHRKHGVLINQYEFEHGPMALWSLRKFQPLGRKIYVGILGLSMLTIVRPHGIPWGIQGDWTP